YNYFIEVQLRKIVQASAEIRSDVDHNFYIRYSLHLPQLHHDHEPTPANRCCRFHDIYLGTPRRADEEQSEDKVESSVTPNECRLRDMTYAAPILVDFEYVRGRQRVK